MGKILVWVIIALVIMMVMRIVASRAASRQKPAPKNEPTKRAKAPGSALRGQPDPTLGAAEEMVRCAHCGIFLPRSEALLKNGKTWCSNTHAQLGVRQD